MKRLTGLNPVPMFHAMSDMSMPFDSSPSDASADAAVPDRNGQKNQFCQANSGNPESSCHDARFDNGLADTSSVAENGLQNVASANKMGRTASMQRVAS